ncbi:MAG: MarR family transcriptional regulator [Flavobacteriaceae bacterium]|nr:MAG: MarR family transcriptional regulator [Flavobacteriaceae bacterium]
MNINANKENVSLPAITIDTIMVAGNWMNELYSDHLKPYGLSVQQLQVLRFLKKRGGKPANLLEIQDQMLSKNSNTTRLVEKLRLKNHITRVQNPNNRRMVEIRITKAGEVLLAQIETTMKDFEKKIRKNVTKRDMVTLIKILNKLGLP